MCVCGVGWTIHSVSGDTVFRSGYVHQHLSIGEQGQECLVDACPLWMENLCCLWCGTVYMCLVTVSLMQATDAWSYVLQHFLYPKQVQRREKHRERGVDGSP